MRNHWCDDGPLTPLCLSNIIHLLLKIQSVGAPRIHWNRTYQTGQRIDTGTVFTLTRFWFSNSVCLLLYKLGCKSISSQIIKEVNYCVSNNRNCCCNGLFLTQSIEICLLLENKNVSKSLCNSYDHYELGKGIWYFNGCLSLIRFRLCALLFVFNGWLVCKWTLCPLIITCESGRAMVA